MKGSRLSKLISFTICFLMVFSLMPVSALADGSEDSAVQTESTLPGEQGSGTPSEQSGETPPDGSGTLPPDGSGTLPPDGSGTLTTDGSGTLPPDGSGTLTPDGSDTLTPDGSDALTPDGSGTLTPDGSDALTPDGSDALLEETVELPAPGPFTVQFSINNVIDNDLTQTIDAGLTVSRPANPEVPNGKEFKDMVFLYWTAKDDVPYEFSAVVTSSFVLYAKFGVPVTELPGLKALGMAVSGGSNLSYDITYILDGGKNDRSNPSTYRTSSPEIRLWPATKFGYEFDGWTPDGGVIPAGSSGPRTFTAHWKNPISYTVNIVVLGGPSHANKIDERQLTNVTPETMLYYLSIYRMDLVHAMQDAASGLAGADHDLSEYEVTNNGSISMVPDGTNTYKVEIHIRGNAFDASYTVHYLDEAGAKVQDDAFVSGPTLEVGDSVSVTAPATINGYTRTSASPVTIVLAYSGNEVTFRYASPSYPITYELNGGTNNTANPPSYKKSASDFPLSAPVKLGYNFTYWSPNNGVILANTTGALTFTAHWSEPIVYTITYKNMDGATNPASNLTSYTVNTTTFSLAAPSKPGYSFIRWDSASATTITKGVTTGNLEFTAVWSDAVKYSIYYYLSDPTSPFATNHPENPAEYTVEDGEIIIKAPSRPGYNFISWSNGGKIPAGSTGSKAFVASWSDPIEYTITYKNMDGATNPSTNLTSYTVNTETFTLATPSRSGYSFVRWDLTAAASTTIKKGVTTGNLEFTAVWSDAIKYSIYYFLSDSTSPFATNHPENPAEYTVEDGEIIIKAPSRPGYNFISWSNGGKIPAGSTGSKAFVASWSDPIEYTITYKNMDGATNPSTNLTSYTVNTETFTLAAPSRSGYSFERWDLTAAASTTIKKGVTTGNLEFTAVWSAPISYTIEYNNLLGASNPATNLTSYTVNTPTFILTAPSRPGYNFVRWDSTFSTTIAQGSTGDKAYTAVWSAPITYSITYNNLLGGTNPASNLASYTVETPTFALAAPTRIGYDFIRWDSTSSTTITQGVTTGDLVFTAVWSAPIEYTITYKNLEDATNPATNLEKYTVNTETFTLADPTRTGYYFTGWSEPDTTIKKGSTGNLVFTANWAKLIDLTLTANSAKYDYDGLTKRVGGFTSSISGLTFGGTTAAGASRRLVGIAPVPFSNTGSLIIYKDGVDVTRQYSVSFVEGSLMIRPRIRYVADVNKQLLFTEWVDYGTGDASYALTPPKNITTGGNNYYFTGSYYAPMSAIDVTANMTIEAIYAHNKILRITADTDTRVYSGAVQSITTAAISDTSLTVTGYTVSGSGTDVGFYPVTVALNPDFKIKSGDTDVTYQYDVLRIPGGLTILPATFPVTSSGYSGVYDGSPHGISVSTTVGGATIRYSLYPIRYPNQSTSYTLTNAGTRTVYFVITKDNYVPYFGSETINISRVPIELTAQSQDFTYDGTAHTWHKYAITGGTFVGSQGLFSAAFSPSSTVTNVVDSGTANVITSVTFKPGTLWSNYAMSYKPGVLNVLQSKALGVKADAYSKIYDGSAHGVTASAYDTGTSAAVTADTVIRYSTSGHADPADYLLTASPTSTHFGDSQTVYFVATNPNYFPAFGSAKIDILQRSVILKSATASKVFDSTPLTAPTVEILGDGFVTGEGFLTPPTASGSATNVPDSPAVNTIIVPDLNAVTLAGDYNLSQNPGALSITPRTVTILMDPAQKNYGATDPVFTYSFKTGAGQYDIISGTGVTVTPMRTDASAVTAGDVGIHSGVISTSLTFANPAATVNYSVATEPADFTINPQVVYDANTAAPVTGMPAAQWFAYGGPAALSGGAGAARAGYILSGWQRGATVYALGETIPAITENMTLLAVWAPAPYSVIYLAGAPGVTNLPVNVANVLNTSVYNISGVVPLRAGFTFASWGTSTVTGAAQTYAPGGAFTMPANNVVLSANWIANLSPVIYHPNGGNGATYTEGTHATLSLVTVAGNTFTRPGYRFAGWSETPNGPAVQQPGNTFVMPAAEVHYYARWEQLFYTVTYMVSGGTLDGLDGATPFATYTGIAYGAAVPVPEDPAQNGYGFDGWTTDIPITMPDSDLTIYGKLTQQTLRAEVIPDQRTPLAGPTWSLVNLILTVLSVLGIGSIVTLFTKGRKGKLTGSDKLRLFTLIPAVGAALCFFLTQHLSGSMIAVDRWTILSGIITAIQGALIAFGFRSKAPKA